MAAESPKPPAAFLSYTRFDDQHDGGAISEFCKRLASAVRAVTGVHFEIFQDVEGIGVGEHWPGKLDQMLNEGRFFIPIVTPSYFTSKACREELEKFLRAEADRERNDLVLPIYYIECELLENDDLRSVDALASTLHERQRQDWRELRFEPFDAKEVRRALERLAREIVKARRRPMPLRRSERDDARSADEKTPTAFRHTEIGVGETLALLDSSMLSRPETRHSDRVFRDIDEPWCPEMVVIPPGEFMMGSTEAECQWAVSQGAKPEWVEPEKPQHLVRITYPLAVGNYPVAFEEYDHYAQAAGRAKPRDQGWGRGRRPVINVDWEDAKAFAAWLSVQTRQDYRLLSEAEWEYACRAGTTMLYWWGDDITPENANYDRNVGATTEVGSYAPNPWGLYDMNGNVREWVQDCWNDSYDGAPDDGSAWADGDCYFRVLRGGCWYYRPDFLRSACRLHSYTEDRAYFIGFRVARTLTPQPAASPRKDTCRSKLEYHDPELTGRVTFNYSNNNGGYSIGRDEFFFETKWSKASDQTIHLYNDPPSIVGVAEAPDVRSYRDVKDPASYDMSSRARTIQEGEHAILKNRHNKYAVLRILDIKDRTRSDTVDEVTFEFWILTDAI